MNKSTRKRWSRLICVFLILAILAVYWPVHKHKFVKYDDDKYVTHNRQVQSGLNWQSIRWAFTTDHASNWHPLTWLSHMLDCQLFGTTAGAHHLTNVLLHIANTLLLFAVLKRMTAALWASAFVAAIFGLHPLHVESVAWVAERKDVLSTFFWMLTMWAYVRYAEHPKLTRYLLTLLCFVLGLMAKPMIVTLPFVLLLLDYWPLRRIQLAKWMNNGDVKNHSGQKPVLHLVAEKVPFLVLSVISSVITFYAQRSGGALHTIESLGVKSRISNAIVSYAAYIGKMVWPSRLAVLYPYAVGSLTMSKVVVSGLLLVLISICFIYIGRRHRYLVVGWLWYLGTLVPVIGLVQVGVQAMADRYTYIPLTGLFIVIAWGLSNLAAGRPHRKVVLAAAALAVLAAATVCTSRQLRYWQNSIKLFKHTLDVTDNNWLMHNNYANLLQDLGQIEEAIEHFNRSLQLKGDSPEIHNNLGNAFSKLDQTDKAIEHYKKALSLKPNFSEAHYNLAVALTKQEKTDEAIAEYREALRFKPDDVDALSNLGFELAQKNKNKEAIEYYKKALALEPDNVFTHGRLGLALASVGKTDEAIDEFQFVLKKRPGDAEMHCNVGILLQRQGNIPKAIWHYHRALQIKPDYTEARKLLEAALAKQ